MDRNTKTEDEEKSVPIWLIALVGLAVIGVFAGLLISFFSSSVS